MELKKLTIDSPDIPALSNYRMHIRLIREIEKYGMLIGGIRAQTVIWLLLRIMSRSGFGCMTESRMNQKATLM